MELQQIKTKTNWQEAVDAMNANSQAIQIEFGKVGEKNKGYYVSIESLNAAHPTGNVGDFAYVGTVAPFAIYTWNGSTWEDSGETGGSEEVDLSGFLPISGGTISGNLNVDGDVRVADSITVGEVVVKGKTNKDVLLGDGTTKNVDELGSLKTAITSDENEYTDVF